MIKLTITEKGGEPKALSFDKDEVSIGRVSGNDIVLPKGNVSKRHSKLVLRNGQVEIADLKSTNGTYVNGRKITETMTLSGNDRVYVGDFLITIEGLAPGEAASASRRLPVPPPPPLPPSRTGSSAVKLPATDDDDTGMGGDDEDEAPLAAKPPRAGRMPPPPPPPRRPPTPISSPSLEDEDSLAADSELAGRPSSQISVADEATGNAGLFEPRVTDDHSSFEANGSRQPTHSRPGAALAMESAAAAEAAAASAAGEPSLTDGLEALLADATVTQILITGPDATYVDRGQGLTLLTPGLGDPNAVADALWRIANGAVPPPPPDNPVVDVRLPDGTHVAAVFPPASPAGVVASIRRPALPARELADLTPNGAQELQTLLAAAVSTQRNLLITGDPAAVTAIMGAIAGAIPAERRVVSIGGGLSRARAGWTELAAGADMPALVRVATALRGEHLLVVEAAGAETLDLLMSAARGQEGLAIALPARAAGEALARLEALAMQALGAGSAAAAPLVASTIDLVIHAVASADGGPRVVEIAEPRADGAHVTAEPVATWRSDGERRSGAGGKLQVHGVSARLGAAFAAAGTTLPGNLLRK